MAAIDRPVRFVIEESYFEHPLLRPCLKALGAIPISARGGPRKILRSMRERLDKGGFDVRVTNARELNKGR